MSYYHIIIQQERRTEPARMAVPIRTTASGSFDGNMSPTGISIGGTTGGELNGTIRNVRIGQRQLSASELLAITS